MNDRSENNMDIKFDDIDRKMLADIIYDCFTNYHYLTERDFAIIAMLSMRKVIKEAGGRRNTIYKAIEDATEEQILSFIMELIKESVREGGQTKRIVEYLNIFLKEKGIVVNEQGGLVRCVREEMNGSVEIKCMETKNETLRWRCKWQNIWQ